MKNTYLLLLMMAAVISFNCQKEISLETGLEMIPIKEMAPITATVQGNLLNETGQPAAGVLVSVGAKNTTTEARGYFRITAAALDKNAALVTASKNGYFKAYRSFRATAGLNQVVIQLIKKTLAGAVNSSAGGTIAIPGGASVSLTANGIVKSDGNVYNGRVDVYAAYIDPTVTTIGNMVPGSFMANDRNRERTVLASYGMLAVELESSTGEKLQLAPGTDATITSPIPAILAASAPASIPLWYLEEKSGLWEEEGDAQRNGDRYVGRVRHFTYWNCDISLPSVGFTGLLTSTDGKPLKNVYVLVGSPTTNRTGYAHGFTDSLGRLSGLIPANTPLVLEVKDQCFTTIFSKNIGPFTSYANLGNIAMPAGQAGLVTVMGKLATCNNTPVTNGAVLINYNNQLSYTKVNGKGEFSTTLLACPGSSQTLEITGADLGAMQQGNPNTIAITRPVTNAGNIIACGVGSQEYIKYRFEGQDYSLNKIGFDSLQVYSYTGNTATLTTRISGFKLAGNTEIGFRFEHVAPQPGVYPLTTMNVNGYYSSTINAPSTVTITDYPQQPGSFYQGSFSGTFKDSVSTTINHVVSGSFRIKRQF